MNSKSTSNGPIEKEWLFIGLFIVILGLVVILYFRSYLGFVTVAQGILVILIFSWPHIIDYHTNLTLAEGIKWIKK